MKRATVNPAAMSPAGHREVGDDKELRLVQELEHVEEQLSQLQEPRRARQLTLDNVAAEHQRIPAELADYYQRRAAVRQEAALTALAGEMVGRLAASGWLDGASSARPASTDIVRRTLAEVVERGTLR